MGLLIPRIQVSTLPLLLRSSALAALAFGTYGALHNQISFTVCPEYFTHFKFDQFAWANPGLQARFFAATVGFMAAWPGGFFGIWFLARYRVQRLPNAGIERDLRHSIAILLVCSAIGAALGLLYGDFQVRLTGIEGWEHWRDIGITDLEGFARAGSMHNGAYIGSFAGVFGTFWRVGRRTSPAPKTKKPAEERASSSKVEQ